MWRWSKANFSTPIPNSIGKDMGLKRNTLSTILHHSSVILYRWILLSMREQSGFPSLLISHREIQNGPFCNSQRHHNQHIFPPGKWQESTRAQTPPWSRWKFQRWVQRTKAEKKHLTHFSTDESSRGQPQSVSHVEVSFSWNSPMVDSTVCTYLSHMEYCHTNCKGCGKTQQTTKNRKSLKSLWIDFTHSPLVN